MSILLNKPVAPNLKSLIRYLEQVNSRGHYTNFGPLHQKLTDRLEEYLSVENLLLVANGTLALNVAYRALDVKSAICTPFTFAATAGSLAWERTPFIFADIESESLNLDPVLVGNELGRSDDIDSIVATHVYGNPCDLEAYETLRKEHKIKVIYDGAHAFNVRYRGTPVLKFGDASTLSFHATKVFHTIEGGAVVFKEKDAYERARRIINFGLDAAGMPKEVGINAKLSEYHCAVGLTLLENIDEILEHRVELFKLYKRSLEDCVQLPHWDENASLNGAYFPIILKNENHRQRVKLALKKSNIPSREYFSPSLNTIFRPQQECHISESAAARILCLPIHYYLTGSQVMKIVKVIKRGER